jgi:hypothetical protein
MRVCALFLLSGRKCFANDQAMFPFQKILFPVDYSELCQAVVPYVKKMVRRFSADLTVVHAYGGEALAYSRLPLTDPEVANEARAFEEHRLRDSRKKRSQESMWRRSLNWAKRVR